MSELIDKCHRAVAAFEDSTLEEGRDITEFARRLIEIEKYAHAQADGYSAQRCLDAIKAILEEPL